MKGGDGWGYFFKQQDWKGSVILAQKKTYSSFSTSRIVVRNVIAKIGLGTNFPVYEIRAFFHL